MVKVIVSKFGDVEEKKAGRIIEILDECYRRLDPLELQLVDLYLFKSSRALNAFLSRERSMVGVVSAPFDESFFATHDAWRGTSRIMVCLERMDDLPELVRVGILRHEAGHSVLHGSLEYYIFSTPQPLAEALDKFAFTKNFSFDLLYLISTAVKDFEVTRLLLDKAYFDDQVAYSRFLLSTTKEDLTVWQIAEGNPLGMALCLVGRLKELACAAALFSRVEESEIISWVKAELSYLPEKILVNLLKVMLKFPKATTSDTSKNVEEATKILVEDLLNPLFEKRKESE